MRKQIAAANWKMNLTAEQGEALLSAILSEASLSGPQSEVIFAVPFPYLERTQSQIRDKKGFFIAAQNCSSKKSGAYTGEVSAEMLQSIGILYCVIGHSERREYFLETGAVLAEKVNICLQHNLQPLFCCGESLSVREKGTQNAFVQAQLEESLFHLNEEQIKKVVLAYEPVWAIGTGKTASTEQAQEMHAFIRSVMARQYGQPTADGIPILYGGSVKGANAAELFASADVDGGLVGGASLVASDFIQIIKALKQ
ncbi:MAG: triose-phosphate isomerase [Chitinophagaceae bacterium]